MRPTCRSCVAFVLLLTFVVLVLAFRSVVIAGTAIALNLLSVGAAYGLLVLVFQHGPGRGPAGVPLQRRRDLAGSRCSSSSSCSGCRWTITCSWSPGSVRPRAGCRRRTPLPRASRASAGVVTSAAIVMVGVFSIFATLSLLDFKQLGVGLAAAVLHRRDDRPGGAAAVGDGRARPVELVATCLVGQSPERS